MEKIIQITSGRGPVECTWVVAQVLKKVLQEAETFNLKATVLQHEAGSENGTVASAMVQIIGNEAEEFVASWLGTIQWIGKSTFRKFHKRSNWFIGIFEVAAINTKAFSEKDIQYQAMRSSGAGGQHVNKVSSAVRAIHQPSGISVFVQESRSQLQNKKIARERIREKLEKVQSEKLVAVVNQTWSQHHQLERGNPVRTFTGMDFKPKKAEKTFKKQRNQLKQDLKKELNG